MIHHASHNVVNNECVNCKATVLTDVCPYDIPLLHQLTEAEYNDICKAYRQNKLEVFHNQWKVWTKAEYIYSHARYRIIKTKSKLDWSSISENYTTARIDYDRIVFYGNNVDSMALPLSFFAIEVGDEILIDRY